MKVNKVVAYYDSTVAHRDDSAQIAMWMKSWKANGWEVELMGPTLVRQYSRYDWFAAACRELKTKNARDYEWACFARWLAYDLVSSRMDPDEAVLLCDYDILNRGFAPGYRFDGPIRFLSTDSCPPLVCRPDFISSVIAYFMEPSHTGLDHASDMILLEAMFSERLQILTHEVCRLFGSPLWKQAQLVHYATSTITKDRVMAEFAGNS